MHILDNADYRADVGVVARLDLPWERLAGAAIVVSGASGLIGSFLVDVLMERAGDLGCTVRAIARDGARLAERFRPYAGVPGLVLTAGDVCRDPVTGPADYVVHAASNTHPVAYASDPIGTIMTNVTGTAAMLDCAVQGGARRAVFLSSVEIYGEGRGGNPLSETDLGYLDCNTVRAGYPESKRVGEALCQAYRARHGLDVVIPRLPRVYGPTMRPDDSKALSQFLSKALAGEDIVLKSAGDQVFSYCHVADAVGAILTVWLRGEPGQAYNVAAPSGVIRLADLAGLVAQAAGRHVVFEEPNAVEQRGFSTATVAVMDGTKLAALGWRPEFDLARGVARTLAILRTLGEASHGS